MLNSMIGGTMLALPLLFRDTGMITSLIILLLSGFISSKTCNIFLIHLAPKDNDVQDSIRRIMKGRWYEFFCLITGFYLITLNVLYVVLINDQFYNILAYIFDKSGKASSLAPKN
jgi:amino acid permease